MKKTAVKLPPSDPDARAPLRGEERRRCKRVGLSFPLEVSGFDGAGKLFRDRTVTTDVSDEGCRFDLLHEVRLEDTVTIQIVSRSDEKPTRSNHLRCRVAWVAPSKWGWSVGVEVHPQENFWHVAFPR